MEAKKQIFNYKFGIVKINESLSKYDNIILFPEKLEMAKEHFKKIGLPKETEKQK